eukprot:4869027-Pyramimonas_sp.AAC.1
MGQGPPLGNLVADAVIRRLGADSWARDHARADRPSGGGAPMGVDGPRDGGRSSISGGGSRGTALYGPPPDPVQGPSPLN